MFTCSTLQQRVCKSRVTGYTARRNRRQYYDLNLDEIFRFYGALLPYPHADGISIVMVDSKGTREIPRAITLFIVSSDYYLIIGHGFIVLLTILIRNGREAKFCKFFFKKNICVCYPIRMLIK